MLQPRSHSNAGLQILHLEDNLHDAELIEAALQVHLACHVTAVATRVAFETELERDIPDFILSDSSLSGFAGKSALALARRKCPGVPFIFCSGDVSEAKKADALAHGATDCISKDNTASLVLLIKSLCEDKSRSA